VCIIVGILPSILNKILYTAVMDDESSFRPSPEGGSPNRIRPVTLPDGAAGSGGPGPSLDGGGVLDEVDRRIVRELARDARLPNNALADRTGIAPSTCLGRVRSLRERGVIRGYHADVDPAALGRPLQAMIAVRLQSHARGRIRGFVADVAGLPEVLNVFFLAGKDDFLLHVAAASTASLRDFVETLSSNADVSYTETSLIFEHVRADAAG
jgi:DNA-binding Lrp family transcriptional regulator